MVTEYVPVQIKKKHLMTRIDEKLFLIDTGSPISFVNDPIDLFGNRITPNEGSLEFIDKVSSFVDCEINGLIGNDYLLSFIKRSDNYAITFDLKNMNLRLEGSPITDTQAMKMELLLGWPVINLKAMGKTCKFVIDTGATQTFISKNLARGHDVIGTINEFTVDYGRFETDLVSVNAFYKNRTESLSSAVLPSYLEEVLKKFNIEGILGLDVFNENSITITNKNVSPVITLN